MATEQILESRTTGHSLRIKGCTFRMKRNFFSQRTVNWLNLLPQKPVEAKSLVTFKTEIDWFLIGKVIKGYWEKAGESG